MEATFFQEILRSDDELLEMLKELRKDAGPAETIKEKDDLTAVITENNTGIPFTEEEWTELQKTCGKLAENAKKKQILLREIDQLI